MIRLYVESNFILEHVLQHDESPHVEKIIALAEERSIDLAIPTLALLEPFSTVTNNANRRNSLSNSFTQQLRELDRSVPTRQLAAALKPLIESLVSIVGDETSRLQSIVSRLLQCARSLPFTQACFTQALNLRGNIGLSP